MLNKTKIALVVALVLGAATAAQAGAKDDGDYGGGPSQTWQDIEHARADIQAQIQREYHPGSGAFASAPKKHVSH